MYVGTVKKSLHFTNQNHFSNLITSLQFLLGTRHQIMIGIIIHTDTSIDQINQGKNHELLLVLNNKEQEQHISLVIQRLYIDYN